MSGRRDSLSPPDKDGIKDSGAHELDSSESEDHFSDAQSAPRSTSASPLPKLRVEKIDDEPSYGEVPGTEAYKMREGDAAPDEIAILPQDNKTAGAEEQDQEEDIKSPSTPGGQPIPKTVVEESSGNSEAQSHPEVKHKADTPADLVVKSPVEQDGTVEPISPALTSPRSVRSSESRRKSSIATPKGGGADDDDGGGGDDEAFGDDFDDFEDGDEDAEFDDFEDGFQEPGTPAAPAPISAPAVQPLSFPIPDFDGLDPDDIVQTAEPYLNALFPTTAEDAGKDPVITPAKQDHPIFLTPRSASLWSQLVAPPPLQPPDWIRSRIRRLFLVSLGVPVDLDEILPASKQKKLVLPSMNSPRTSTDSRRSGSRAPGGKSSSPTSGGTPGGGGGGGGDANGGGETSSASNNNNSTSTASSKRRGAPPPPEFDIVAARQLCATTDEALDGMTDAELRAHVERLGGLEGTAKAVLEYWQLRTDEQIKEREAFEGVIENLVKHARKTRK